MITRYSSVGEPSPFRDNLALLVESIRDVDTRSEWNLIPVALCLRGEENVPMSAVAELTHMGFAVKLVDPVVEEKDISPDATPDFIAEIKVCICNQIFGETKVVVESLSAMVRRRTLRCRAK